MDLNDEASWDSISPDYRVASARAGKDFYIYACAQLDGTFKYLLSANSTVPAGYTADNSRKVGGFHCLCVNVGTITGHTLTGYVAGDILPASVWDLSHRPTSATEGMVYDSGTDVWVDIYLASYSGSYATDNLKMVSAYGGVTADGTSTEKFHWHKFSQVFATQKKRLLTQREFVAMSIGSNQSTNILGSADPNTTGGHKDTTSRRMISNIGVEDACGALWQWGCESGGAYGAAAYVNAYDANDKNVGGQSYNESCRAFSAVIGSAVWFAGRAVRVGFTARWVWVAASRGVARPSRKKRRRKGAERRTRFGGSSFNPQNGKDIKVLASAL